MHGCAAFVNVLPAAQAGAEGLVFDGSTALRAPAPGRDVLPRILISNGFGRFPLAHLAAELRTRDWDIELLTGAYPRGHAAALLRHIPGIGLYRAGRFEDRRVEIDPERVHPDFASELVYNSGMALRSRGARRLGRALVEGGVRLAGVRAARRLARMGPVDAYHVRSAFGLDSLEAARRHGTMIVCDHSIVHPAALRPLLQNSGRLPARRTPRGIQGLERLMLYDLERADWVVVNSDFVRETFRWAGYDTSRVKVIYAGVEPEFMDAIPVRDTTPARGPVRLPVSYTISEPTRP
jgi:glycosyltransferase involved in cell wall biosynthesis